MVLVFLVFVLLVLFVLLFPPLKDGKVDGLFTFASNGLGKTGIIIYYTLFVERKKLNSYT